MLLGTVIYNLIPTDFYIFLSIDCEIYINIFQEHITKECLVNCDYQKYGCTTKVFSYLICFLIIFEYSNLLKDNTEPVVFHNIYKK